MGAGNPLLKTWSEEDSVLYKPNTYFIDLSLTDEQVEKMNEQEILDEEEPKSKETFEQWEYEYFTENEFENILEELNIDSTFDRKDKNYFDELSAEFRGHGTILQSTNKNKWALIFEDYKDESVYPDWDILVTYNFGDRVIHTNKCVYECTALNPDGTAAGVLGTSPTDAFGYFYWTKVNDIFIGANERVKYSAQKLLFEYALNKFNN